MDFRNFVRPKIQGQYCSLEQLSRLIRSTPEDLLDAACEGKLQVFVRKPAHVRIFSVHADALDLEDGQLFLDKVFRKVTAPDAEESAPIEMLPLDSDESLPLNMSASTIEGLRLTRWDCQQIRVKERVWQFLFVSGITTNYSWVEEVPPLRGHFCYRDKQTLRPDGWNLACYGLTQPIQFHEGIGYSRPQGIELSLDKLFATSEDIDRYLDTLDLRVQLAAYIVDGRIVIDKLPDYLSKKLVYLIESNDRYWGLAVPSDLNEVTAIKERVRRHLMAKEFQELFDADKGKISPGQLSFCKQCITPISVRDSKAEWSSEWPMHLTPELLVMLAVAMRTWGRPRVKLEDVSSHPLTEDLVKLFREMGVKGDDAKYAPTIIRPEAASKGRPVPPTGPLQSGRDSLTSLRSNRG